MEKEQWLKAAYAVLEDIFKQVKEFDDPIFMPICGKNGEGSRTAEPEGVRAAARLNGLAASFLAAAPLLRNDPEAKAGGHLLREYYKNQIKKCAEPDFVRCLFGTEGQGERETGAGGQEIGFQNLRGAAALCFGLAMCEKVVWDSYTKEERDGIVGLFGAFDAADVSVSGRGSENIFLMLILAFLNREGYPIDPDMMRDLAQAVLSDYVGDGWYREGKAFDCDSFWAFQVFGPLWNRWYGYQHEPYIAWKLEEYSNTLVKTLPMLFDKEGRWIRWGREGINQSAAAAPLAANFFLNHPQGDPGLARETASLALRHTVTGDPASLASRHTVTGKDSFYGTVLFYGTASFFCLAFPDGHPFWTAPESRGVWEEKREKLAEVGQVVETVFGGPGLVATNLRSIGVTDLRPAKVLLKKEDADLQAYSRLSWNSRYPWEAFDLAGAEAMQYCLLRDGESRVQIPNLILSGGHRGQVLYRKLYFDFVSCMQDSPSIGLADFPVANGLVRVDRVHISGQSKPYTLTLGAYGMPAKGEISVERREKNGARALILSSGEEQMAFVTYAGFESIEIKKRQGVNPLARDSVLMYGVCRRNKGQGQREVPSLEWQCRDYVLVSAVLLKNGGGQWSDEELFPIKRLRFGDRQQCGGMGPISLNLWDGRSISVDFEALDGQLSI